MADDAGTSSAAAAAAPPVEVVERRDDSETVTLLDSEFRTEDNSAEDEIMMNVEAEEDEDEDAIDDLNATRFDDDDDSKIDINSVLSGNMDTEDDDDGDDDQMEGVFGKNLGAIFDDADEMDRHLKTNPAAAASFARPASSGIPSRPPLAPGRPATAPLKSNSDAIGKKTSTTAATDDKRLSVFLRVRPPVCANGKKGNEGAINTIEVISDKAPAAAATEGMPPLPTTIRTYPPLNSNAAKVVRGSTKRKASNSSLNSSKSLIDDGSSDSGVDPNAEVRGVKEYAYSGVFGPNAAQSDVYNNVAAPLVEGLFPQSESDDALGESALLFTLGVTNAGKTHTVMGTGFETKADKKKMQRDNFAPNENWGIIPRSLDHMLARINGLNEKATTGPQLQMYMSYLEIYNEQIYDLLPNKSDDAPKRRPCDGPPTLKLRESRRGRIFVRGLARHAVDNVQHGLEFAQMAKSNRHTASNNINAESSRSHSICQLEIAHAPSKGAKRAGMRDSDLDSECETDDESVCSKSGTGSKRAKQRKSTIIWIVDLAGSERSKRTRSHTRHQKEAALINASLMNLMRCLREMLNHQPKKRGAVSKGGVVPFRDSKLTHMFMNHLTGPAASRTCMVVNVNPAADDYDETQHILGYAATARSVTVSAVDYNRKRRMFAKESKVKTSPKKSAIAKIVKKLSPKKRKGTIESNPAAKRFRSNSNTSLSNSRKITRSAASAASKPPPRVARSASVARKPLPRVARVVKSVQKGGSKDLEQLREENFALKVTVDGLQKELETSETEVRTEVVEMMNEQLSDSKAWYENRISQLQDQIAALQSSKQAPPEVQNNEAELIESIAECEEEMKRMRDDHTTEVEDLTATHLHLVQEHQAEMESLTKEHEKELCAEQEKSKRLEDEAGALRHQSKELQVSHASLLTKYTELLAAQQDAQMQEKSASSHDNKENPSATGTGVPESPSTRRLPRERVSDVASTASCVDIVSPKKKRGGWFMRSPAKVAAGESDKMSPAKPPGTRSPLGNIN